MENHIAFICKLYYKNTALSA